MVWVERTNGLAVAVELQTKVPGGCFCCYLPLADGENVFHSTSLLTCGLFIQHSEQPGNIEQNSIARADMWVYSAVLDEQSTSKEGC